MNRANNHRLIAVLVTVIFVLLVTVIVQAMEQKGFANETADMSPFIDPSRQFYQADDLVVNTQPLLREFALLEKNSNISVYFEALNTGANISINKDAAFFPASLLKVPLVMAVAKKIEQGAWTWDTTIALAEADKNKDFGTLWQQPSGTLFRIEELVKETLIHSDNTAYFMLLNHLDPDELLSVQNHLGLADFISADLKISAKKYAPILRALYSATYLSVADSGKILRWMSESDFDNYLAGGMPSTIAFAHKIGVEDERNVYLDAGIVYLPNRPYILIVMVKNYEAREADAIMHDIARRVYNYMAEYPKTL